MTTLLTQCLELPCGLRLPNRLVKPAMSEQLACSNGDVSELLVQLYEVLGRSGPGLLIAGDFMVDPRYRRRKRDLTISGENTRLPRLSELARIAKQSGSKVFAQITHPGILAGARVCARPVGPSSTNKKEAQSAIWSARPARKLTSDEIDHIIDRFAEAAQNFERAGFDGVPIQAGDGDLIAQFLDAKSNRRSDQWSGSRTNRSRLLLEIIRAIRGYVSSSFAVSVKLGPIDSDSGGFSLEESEELIDWLNHEAVDFIELSGLPDSRILKVLRSRTSIPLMLSGCFDSLEDLHELLNERRADLVGLQARCWGVPETSMKLLSESYDTSQVKIDHRSELSPPAARMSFAKRICHRIRCRISEMRWRRIAETGEGVQLRWRDILRYSFSRKLHPTGISGKAQV